MTTRCLAITAGGSSIGRPKCDRLSQHIIIISSSFYFVHTFRDKTTSNASDILNRTYQAQGALTVAHKNKNKIININS